MHRLSQLPRQSPTDIFGMKSHLGSHNTCGLVDRDASGLSVSLLASFELSLVAITSRELHEPERVA